MAAAGLKVAKTRKMFTSPVKDKRYRLSSCLRPYLLAYLPNKYLKIVENDVFSITTGLKTDFAAVFALRRCAEHSKAVKIAVMQTQTQISELTWFGAFFIAADHSTLAHKSHAFVGENCHVILQGLRCTLR